METFSPTNYKLCCIATSHEFNDSGWDLSDKECKRPSLIRTVYQNKQIHVGDDSLGFYKFKDWLPVHRMLSGSAPPVTFKSKELGKFLGLSNLYITLSGFYPEVGARMTTCSFKETEAYSVCGRLPDDSDRILVVASAGNSSRAFAKVCSENNINLLLCVPEDNINALWFEKPLNKCVKLICTPSGSDYFDAIYLSDVVVQNSARFFGEGGAKNIARRDGMGTTVLSAAVTIGRIPDYYFQAVGSGTGAIAAWEAANRLRSDGRFGTNTMNLMLSQNAPFLPIFNAWTKESRELLPYDDNKARRDVEIIDAKVLSNRHPPYSITGGIFDALSASGGKVFAVTNEEARTAAKLFEQFEGIDINEAAAVAVGSLIQATHTNMIKKDACVMLNITGAGEKLYKKNKSLWYLKPEHTFAIETSKEEIVSVVEKMFATNK